MTSRKILVSFVAILALAVLMIAGVSAVATNQHVEITDVEVSGVDVLGGGQIAEFSGSTVPVRVQFLADELPSAVSQDVRVKAWISGSASNAAVTGRFDVLAGRTYTRTLSVPISDDLDDDETEEDLTLNVLIESKDDGTLSEIEIDLTVQKESYLLEVLDVDMSNEVKAGDVLVLDVVLKNVGRRFADDTFVVARVPALGIEDRAYFGDLSAVDQSDPDKENTNERRLALRFPKTAPAGIYIVEIEALNEDSITSLTRRVVVSGASSNTMVLAPIHSKTFAAGQSQEYSLTLVNTGSNVEVYELVVDSSGINVVLDEPVVVVPAGSSKTVKLTAVADSEGKKNFAVNVHSGTELVKTESFTANVEGGSVAGNATVLLTVILAIVFVVLLVVLIVLLTRQPQKSEEFGESYY